MPLIQSPTIGRKLQRNLRLTELPDSVLAPEIVAVIIAEDLSAPLGDQERGCMGSVTVQAVAAENSIVVLTRAGAPAGYDLRVTAVSWTSPVTQLIRLTMPTVAVTGLVLTTNTGFTDFTLPGRPTSPLGGATPVATPAGRILFQGRIEQDTTFRLPVDIRLGTIGDGNDFTSLMVVAVTANTVLRASFEWTESAPQG